MLKKLPGMPFLQQRNLHKPHPKIAIRVAEIFTPALRKQPSVPFNT